MKSSSAGSNAIPSARQEINDADIESVCDVLRSDWLTQGPIGRRFECELATYCGVEFAVAVSSATAGLHLACLALGLPPPSRDLAWNTPIFFVASLDELQFWC
jgi:dTDP-4-amino-4,6-dideoxygalactose transaminase